MIGKVVRGFALIDDGTCIRLRDVAIPLSSLGPGDDMVITRFTATATLCGPIFYAALVITSHFHFLWILSLPARVQPVYKNEIFNYKLKIFCSFKRNFTVTVKIIRI